ncbi:DinB family protein [Allobranchiibius sp. CTAmp26]|uniref:DinB family protein n=1 Tax=Allobranchiibius sp. CTAmp26 TaxID=2815214 RepID=UPI001AA0DDB1|nr:DinB family protein [Allobranchiibius sp. CTAmp26]MBO1753667.1 DinB family protein [Allobranchiibius sp. CTAmp26]
MPSQPSQPSPPPHRPDEIDGLLGFLEWQRHGIRYALDGITDAQARLRPIPSTTLTLGGLLKHVVATERSWIRTDVERGEEEPRTDEFILGDDETVAELLAAWQVEATHTEDVVRSGIALEREVPDYQGGPSNNVRWVLLHLVEEMARHAGHADLLREAIDGQTYRR